MSELTPELILRGRGGIDPALLAKRRMQQREMSMLREKLTSTSGLERAFDFELLRMFAANWLNATIATLVFLTGATALAALWLPLILVASAAALIAIGLGATLSLGKNFVDRAHEGSDLGQWRLLFAAGQATLGAGWALLIVTLTHSEMDGAHTFGLVLVLAQSALGAMLGATIPGAVRAGQIPIFGGSVGLLLINTSPPAVTMALVTTATLVFFSYLAERLYASAIATISARAEKDALIAELETAKANSDEARRRAEESNLAK